MRSGTRPGAGASGSCRTDAFYSVALAWLVLGMGFTPERNDRVLGTWVRCLEVNRFQEKSCAMKSFSVGIVLCDSLPEFS